MSWRDAMLFRVRIIGRMVTPIDWIRPWITKRYLNQKVSTGMYSTVSEVFRNALKLIEEKKYS